MAAAKPSRKKKGAQYEAGEARRQREANELRREAEERLGALAAAAASTSLQVPEELAAAVHELRVHQIELEIRTRSCVAPSSSWRHRTRSTSSSSIWRRWATSR
jgi:hypothetical protein